MKITEPARPKMRRLRVCLIQLWPRYPHYYCAQLANSLAASCTVSVCVTGDPPRHLYVPGVNLVRIPLRVPVKYRKSDMALLAAQLPMAPIVLCRAIRKISPDVVHIVFSHPYASCAGLYLRKRTPIILDRHDVTAHPGEDGALRRLFDAAELFIPNGLIVHGRRMEQLVATHLGGRKIPVYVIPHGDLSFISRDGAVSPEPSDGSCVLFFGRIHTYKGLDVLLRAIPTVLAALPETRFVIAGAGDWAPYASLIAGIPSQNLTLIREFVSESDTASIFERANLVVLPYREASQSGVIPFAAAFRRTIVATRVGSLPEAIRDGDSGILVEPEDPLGLAWAIISLLKDGEKRHAMADALHEDYLTKFSFNSLRHDYMKCYHSMIRLHASAKTN